MESLVRFTTLCQNLIVIVAAALFIYVSLPETLELEESTTANDAYDANESKGALDSTDIERQNLIGKWSEAGLSDIHMVIAEAEKISSNPKATIEELKAIARKANATANFIGYIEEEYEDYRRDNFQYDFVTEPVSAVHDEYLKLSNILKDIRNSAYLRIGKSLLKSGNIGEAFFYFHDAYRLDVFNSYESSESPGIRFLAEQEMKALLGITEISSYTNWNAK